MKIGVFIDAENIRRSGGYGIRYDVLRDYVSQYGDAIRLNSYMSVDEARMRTDYEYKDRTNGFLSIVRSYGFKIITKAIRWFEDEDGQPGFRRLKVNFNSTSTWALDDLTGERYDLSEGDLCRYTVDKSYLRERLDQLLKQQLIDVPLTVDEQEPYVLGNYRMGDQRLPVALVSRLWEP